MKYALFFADPCHCADSDHRGLVQQQADRKICQMLLNGETPRNVICLLDDTDDSHHSLIESLAATPEPASGKPADGRVCLDATNPRHKKRLADFALTLPAESANRLFDALMDCRYPHLPDDVIENLALLPLPNAA